MADRTSITATRAPDGVVVTVYARGGDVVIRTTLAPRRAMLLGLDLCNLAAEPVFRAVAKKDPAPDGPEPVHPAGVSAPASNKD
jgi:hypothetical protein